MYDQFYFVNNLAQIVDFLGDPTGSGYMCLTAVNYEIVSSTTDRDRMESNTSWPTFTYYKRMLIHLEADILADTPQNFHTFWHGVLQKIMVPATTLQTSRTQGSIIIRPAGVTENWQADVVVDSPPAIPRAGLGPSAGQMTVTFKSFVPYWYRPDHDDYVWHV